MKGDEFTLTLTHPSGMYGCGSSLNSNIMSRPGNWQDMQDFCDDKTATVAVHLDPEHQPRDKSISTQYNYSICSLARAHAAMDKLISSFFLKISSEIHSYYFRNEGEIGQYQGPWRTEWRFTILLENLSWISIGTNLGSVLVFEFAAQASCFDWKTKSKQCSLVLMFQSTISPLHFPL